MPFWKPGEKAAVLRLAAGQRHALTKEERQALDMGWRAEAGYVEWQAREAVAEAHSKQRLARRRGTSPEIAAANLTDSYIEATARYNARWDIWEQAIDMAHHSPQHFSDDETQSNADVWRVAAVLGRRNPTIQKVIQQASNTHSTEYADHHSPTHHMIATQATIERLQIAVDTLQHTAGPHAANTRAMAQALMDYVRTHDAEWSEIVRNTKHRLRLELQAGEEVRDMDYWLPISRIDVQVDQARRKYPARCQTQH